MFDRHSLEHIFGGIAPQVIGHRISTIQGCFHVQAADEVLGVGFVEVQSQLGHVYPVLWSALAEVISGEAILWRRQEQETQGGSTGHRHILSA